jgi:hypothetical protein
MQDLPQSQLLQGYKNLGNHLLRRIHVDHDQLLDGLCVLSEQQGLLSIQVRHDRYQCEYAYAHLATGNEKPAK